MTRFLITFALLTGLGLQPCAGQSFEPLPNIGSREFQIRLLDIFRRMGVYSPGAFLDVTDHFTFGLEEFCRPPRANGGAPDFVTREAQEAALHSMIVACNIRLYTEIAKEQGKPVANYWVVYNGPQENQSRLTYKPDTGTALQIMILPTWMSTDSFPMAAMQAVQFERAEMGLKP